ncbi:MAG: SLBB domain-containing protein [Balneolaceae bacterium]
MLNTVQSRLVLILPVIIFIFALPAAGQNLGNIDFRTIKVDELSDAQVRQIWNRAQNEGMSLNEIQTVALSRGMPQSEVNKLRSRINEIRMRGESDPDQVRQNELRNIQESLRRIEDLSDDQFVLTTDRVEADTAVTIAQIFGASLFSRVSRTFEPSFNIPTPIDYVLGAGDELVVDIWGAAEANYRLTVNPEGVIRIQNLGPIFVDGLTIQEARERIISRLQGIYSGLNPNRPDQANTFAQISLGNVRSIKVTVLGEATQPGTYTITSLSTVFNALYAAGGPGETGSFRSVKVIRGQEIIADLDIYDFLIHGDLSNNIRLRDQDIIKIDPYINRVRVEGELKRNGIFEMKERETLFDLIRYAGGFTEEAYTQRLVLRRNTPVQQSVNDIIFPEGGDFEMKNGDRLNVGRILDRFENRVEIEGAVFREGEYELTPGLTLRDLILKADGLREDAFLSRGIIFRMRDDLSIETIAFHAGQVVNQPGEYDILLKKDDMVRVSSIFDLRQEYTIHVRGAVNSGGEFDFANNMTVEDAIFLAGGFRDAAAPYRVDVARRIQDSENRLKTNRIAEVFQFDVDRNLQFTKGNGSFRLKPFDQVFVRMEPNYETQQIIRIEGEVHFPGEYTLDERNTRISEIIEQAGGLSPYAFPEGASLERRLDEEVDLQEIEVLDTLLVDTQQRRRTTNVGLQLDEIMKAPGSRFDLILRDGDVLTIPRELQTVRVEGEVLSPVSIRFERGKSLKKYIDQAGGVTDGGRSRRAFIVYANGEVDRTKRFLFFRNNPEVRPGATIIVPPKPERTELSPQERIGILTAIVSTAAIVSTTIVQIRR